MRHRSPRTASWELAIRLRRLREQLGLPLKDVAERLGVSSAFWSAVENDRRLPSDHRLGEVCEVLAVSGDESDRLRELSVAARQPAWWDEYADLYTDEALRLFGLEDGATRIRCYEASVVTGLLQTAAYTAELIERDPANAPATFARRVDLRQRRQKRLLDRDPPSITAVLSERALHQVVGTQRSLLEQLEYLVMLSDLLGGALELRIHPFSEPPRGVANASTLVLLSFHDDELLPTMSYYEGVFGSESVAINDYIELCFEQTFEYSLDREQSLEMIRERIRVLGRALRPR